MTTDRASPRVPTPGHLAFALTLIGLGLQGLITNDFTTIWQPVPNGVPAREAVAYLCASLSLACGLGLLWARTTALAARVLLASFVLWFLLWRVRALFLASLIEGTWSCGESLANIAAAWVLFALFATESDRRHVAFATGSKGLRIARVLYGLGLLPFGYAHFANVAGTASLVPHWLPWRAGWAYLTGATFVAAGVAILSGICARIAAALSALQMGLFALLVWVPVVMTGHGKRFQWLEFATTVALTAAGWVVADSYRVADGGHNACAAIGAEKQHKKNKEQGTK